METNTAAPGTSPTRKRRLWLKLLIGITVAVVLLVSIVYLAFAIWRGKERSKVDALIASIRAKGEPTELVDLIDSPVPDARNIVVLLKQAHAASVERSDRNALRDQMELDDPNAFEPALNETEAVFLRAQSMENTAALALLARLSERDLVAWDNRPTSPAINWLLPELNHERRLAYLLGDHALLAAHEGRSLEALEALGDIAPIALATSHRPVLVGYLVAVGIEALAAENYQAIAPDLDTRSPAVGEAMKRTIASLLDDDRIVDYARRGLLGERVVLHDTMRAMASGRINPAVAGRAAPGGPGFVMSPIVYRSEAAALEYLSLVIDNLDAPSKEAFAPTTRKLDAIIASVRGNKTAIFAAILLPSLNVATDVRYKVITDRHLAAIALAIRLYQHDHNGERPATLEALVPTYLPAVPLDGISGNRLRYDATRAIVWGVGEDGVDGNGDSTPVRPKQPAGRHNMKDTIVYLNRQARPATQPAE